jgi:hypothetical protein
MLHDLCGFPLAVTGNGYHAFVVVAPRTALDVFGVRPIREITATFGGRIRHRRVHRSYVESHEWGGVRKPARTRRVALALLELLDAESAAR